LLHQKGKLACNFDICNGIYAALTGHKSFNGDNVKCPIRNNFTQQWQFKTENRLYSNYWLIFIRSCLKR